MMSETRLLYDRVRGLQMGEMMTELEEKPAGRNRPQFVVSIESRLLYDRFSRLQIGELITYREMNELIGVDVQRDGRGAMMSARRMAQRDDQIVLDTVRNIGLKRLSDQEIVASAAGTFGKIQRVSRRGIARLTSIGDWTTLPDADKAMHNASVSALRVVELMSKPKSVNRIAGAVNTTNTGQLPIARTLELFRGPKREDVPIKK